MNKTNETNNIDRHQQIQQNLMKTNKIKLQKQKQHNNKFNNNPR